MVITRYAIRFRTAVFVLMANLVLAGLVAFTAMPREMTPDIQIPVVVVSIPYPGASPVDVEQLILTPVEKELKDLKDVNKMMGAAYEGAAVVTIEFAPEANIDESLQSVRDRVSRVRPKLPADIKDPDVREVSFSDFPIIIVNVSGDYSLERLKRFAEDLQEDVEALPGVLAANLSGGLEQQFRISIDPEAAVASGISLSDVVRAIQSENINLPGGIVDAQHSSYLLRTPADFRTESDLAQVIVKAPGGRPVRLTDVARIERAFVKPTSYARINGTTCVSLQITKRTGANIIEVVDRVKETVDAYEKKAPTGTDLKLLNDQSVVIRDMVDDLVNNIITGLVLVILVIFFFMGARNAALVSVAVPLSMLLTFIVLDAMGVTLNMVTLFSLILALGMLVDNAIVIVENIYRHLGEALKEGDDTSTFQRLRVVAAFTGTSEVAWPVIASTATTVAAFGPLLFWPGIMGKFMGYLPMVVIITLVSSLVVGLIINPVTAAVFMARPSTEGTPDVLSDNWEDAYPGLLVRGYAWVLRVAIDAKNGKLWRPIGVMVMASALLVGSMMAFGASGNGVEFFPETTPKRASVKIQAPNGTHLDASDRIVRQVEGVLGGLDNIKDYVATPGASAAGFKMGGGAANSHVSGVSIDFRDEGDRTENTMVTIAKMREQFTGIAGARLEVEREKQGPPSGMPINVRLSGDDYGELGKQSARVLRMLESMATDGVRDPKTDYVTGRPELQIVVDRQAIKEVGASTSGVAMAIRNAFNGNESSVVRDGTDEQDIVVRFAPGRRDAMGDLAGVRVPGKDGVLVPLSQLAKVVRTSGSGTIRHFDTTRVVTIEADIATGANANKIRKALAKKLDADLTLPPGYAWTFGGENEEQKKAQAFLGRALMMGLFIILLILVTQFNSILTPIIILSSVVLSLIGVFGGLVITGTPFGVVMTGLGVISLAGVVVNNAIVLIDYIEQLRRAGLSAREAVLRAGLTRFRPVILTATTTVLGLVPMAAGWSIDFINLTVRSAGSSGEFWGAMAVAVIFGLVFATVLTLVAVPALYIILDRVGSFARRVTGGGESVDLEKELAATRGTGPLSGLASILLTVGISLAGLGTLAAVTLSPSTASAQSAMALKKHDNPANTPKLDLAALLKRLDKRGPDLQVARSRTRAAALIVDRAWGALHPQVSANGQYTLNDPVIELQFADPEQTRSQAQRGLDARIADLNAVKKQMAANGQDTKVIDQEIAGQQQARDNMPLPVIEPVQINRRHGLAANIRLQMSVYDARTFDGLKIARASAHMARDQLKLTHHALRHAVARAYAGAVLQRDALTVVKTRLTSAKRELEATQKRLTAGVGTRLGERMAQIQVIQAQRGVARALLAYDSSVAALGLMVGETHRFEVTGNLTTTRPDGTVEALVSKARTGRLEMRVLGQQKRLAKLRVDETLKRWLPRLSLVGQSQWSNAAGFAGTNVTSMLMVQLSQQLWDGGMSSLDRKAMREQVRQVTVEAARARARIEAQVRGCNARIAQQRHDVDAAVKALQVSKLALADARAGASAGAATEYEVRALEDRVLEAEISLLQSRTQHALAILDLREAVGLAPM